MALEFTRGAGGLFTGSVSQGTQQTVASAQARRRAAAGGVLKFDGKRGTGYGIPGGDLRVKAVQDALNAAGITDSHGRPLAVDGRYGPLTTSAVKAAQKALGLPQDGQVTPELLAKIKAMPPKKKAAEKPPAAKKPAAEKPAKAMKKPTAKAQLRAAEAPPKTATGGQKGLVKFR